GVGPGAWWVRRPGARRRAAPARGPRCALARAAGEARVACGRCPCHARALFPCRHDRAPDQEERAHAAGSRGLSRAAPATRLARRRAALMPCPGPRDMPGPYAVPGPYDMPGPPDMPGPLRARAYGRLGLWVPGSLPRPLEKLHGPLVLLGRRHRLERAQVL